MRLLAKARDRQKRLGQSAEAVEDFSRIRGTVARDGEGSVTTMENRRFRKRERCRNLDGEETGEQGLGNATVPGTVRAASAEEAHTSASEVCACNSGHGHIILHAAGLAETGGGLLKADCALSCAAGGQGAKRGSACRTGATPGGRESGKGAFRRIRQGFALAAPAMVASSCMLQDCRDCGGLLKADCTLSCTAGG